MAKMLTFFHADNTGSNPVGDARSTLVGLAALANPFQRTCSLLTFLYNPHISERRCLVVFPRGARFVDKMLRH